MNPFAAATEQVASNFKTDYSSEWVRRTGRRQLVNALLDSMGRAQSQQQFDALAYRFKRDILMPYYREVVLPSGNRKERDEFIQRNPLINMRPRKDLGSYADLQRNPAFAQSRYKYLPYGQKDSVPALLRSMGDPAERDLAARELQMTPEDLQSYVQDAYGKQAREQFRKDMLAAASEGQKYRDSLANSYRESMLGTVLGTIAPETTGLRLNQIRKGTGGFDFTRDFLFGRMFPRNGKGDQEKASEGWELAMAIAKDALVGIGSLYAGGAAGKVVSNPAAQSVLGGVIDAGIEGARQGMSNYSDWDIGNIVATGATSATIPALAGMVTSGLGRLPGLRRFTRPLMKKIYGIDNSPAATEAASATARKESAQDAILKAETGDPLARELEADILDETGSFMENSPTRAYDKTPLTRDEVRDIVMDQERAGRYFEPPSPDEFREMIRRRNESGAEDIIDVNGRKVFGSDMAADWLGRAKAQWPENWKQVTGSDRKPNFLERHVGDLVDIASREETMRQRSKGKAMVDNSVSPALLQVMETDPTTIRMWKAGFVPNSGPEKELYDEWKAKVGE